MTLHAHHMREHAKAQAQYAAAATIAEKNAAVRLANEHFRAAQLAFHDYMNDGSPLPARMDAPLIPEPPPPFPWRPFLTFLARLVGALGAVFALLWIAAEVWQ